MSTQGDRIEGDIRMPPESPDEGLRLTPPDRRLRLEFLAGAEEDSRRRLGRGLSADELARVLQHYPGDVEQRRPG